jgi:LSD1 subclass zinc finger protein
MTTGSWARVQCHFRCEHCQRRSPLNHIDMDGSVDCLRCGQANPFEPGQWLDAIDHARARALSGDAEVVALGNDAIRPHRIKQATMVIRAAAGQPTCPDCSEPLEVRRCAVGMLVVGCKSCDIESKYVLPSGTRASKPELGGAIAAAHARGVGEATVAQDSAGVQSVECSKCGAPLDHPPSAVVVRCGYCRITLRVPSRGLATEGDLEPEVWWLFFPA